MRSAAAMSALLLFTMAPGARGDGLHTFELAAIDNSAVLPGEDALVLDFNDGSYFTFDLIVTTVDADFYAAELDATLMGPAEFFQHPAGGLVPPDPNLVEQYPAVEFDTFFDAGPGSDPWVLLDDLVEEPQFIHATWFDTEVDLPNDTYRIARFSFHFLDIGTATLTVEGDSVNPNGSPYFFHIGPLEVSMYYPEPSSLALLTLGGLLSLRRRAQRA